MKNSEYWRKRFKQLEESQHRQGVECSANIEYQYKQVQKQIESKIYEWYGRFADNNNITMLEARKWLTNSELQELKWDVKEYIKYGQENALNGLWLKQLENASAKYHINRLESLKLQLQQKIEMMFNSQLDTMGTHMRKVYTSSYYKTAFEIQKGFEVGWDFAKLDDRKINKVIKQPWAADGKNFSERIWGNRQKLVSELNNTLVQGIILGNDPQKTINTIAKKMNTSKTNAGRLVMTEEAFFSSAAQKDCFNELDVEQYEIVATLDSHTSDICRELDGQVFDMKDHQPGVTAPPFHVWCRSCTAPYFDDEFTQGEERAARGEDGKTYYVPTNMTYKEWEKSLKGDLKEDEMSRVRSEFESILENNPSTPYNDKMLLYNSTTEYELDSKLNAPFVYNVEGDVIKYNPKAPNYEMYDMNYVQAHELSHRMDIREYKSINNPAFNLAIEKSKNIVHSNTISTWFCEGGKYENSFAVSDIISALSNNEIEVPIGHSNQYWAKENNVCLEIFANLSTMFVLNDGALEDIKNEFEELYGAYMEVIG